MSEIRAWWCPETRHVLEGTVDEKGEHRVHKFQNNHGFCVAHATPLIEKGIEKAACVNLLEQEAQDWENALEAVISQTKKRKYAAIARQLRRMVAALERADI